jgi:hypothetical protein
MFETPAASTQRHSKTTADRKYQHTHSTRRMLVSLLALIIALLSWFGIPAVRSLGLKGPSISSAVWMPQNEVFVAEVRGHVCKIPLVTKVLDCGQLSDPEALRNNSIRHTIPGIVFALSENPDTVDEILDILEDIEKDLFVIHESTMGATILPIDHLLNFASILEADLTNWENGKDNLLDIIQTRMNFLNLDREYQVVQKRFRKAVVRDLGHIAKPRELTQKTKLDASMKTWSLILKDTPARLPLSDSEAQEYTSTSERISLPKRLLL